MIENVVSGIKRGFELIKKINDMAKSAEINAITIELQGIILDAQERISSLSGDNFSLTEKVHKLEKEIADLKTWDTERKNYELKEWRRGIRAYVLKEGVESSEKNHALCANCFHDNHKSILQISSLGGIAVVKCPKCKFQG